ncbi:toprim domain-containing protein [Lentisphaerota bacterium WC36G]|nr:toprim domain-containing protein [Lentisphaerae bacterium WC36]
MWDNNYITEEIRSSLLNDGQFQFKRSSNSLRYGKCPKCERKAVFISLDEPWVAVCNHRNNCQWTATTRELYPDIFSNITDRFLQDKRLTEEESLNQAAKAYMYDVRGFDPKVIGETFFQEKIKHKTKNEYYPAIKIIINSTCYWKRIINSRDVARNGAKSKIYKISEKGFKGSGWIPPQMTFEKNDTIIITEGIFKSMSFLHVKDSNDKPMKSIATLSCGNFCTDIVKEHKDKNITWVVAMDSDIAGIDATRKHIQKLKDLKQHYKVMFPAKNEDWDDVFRKKALNEEYISDSYWRGLYHLADSAAKKAFFSWIKKNQFYSIFNYNGMLYRYSIEEKEAASDFAKDVILEDIWLNQGDKVNIHVAEFNTFVKTEKIANCYPNFLYVERPINADCDQLYYFSVDFPHKQRKTEHIGVTGDTLNSPKTFGDALLKNTAGGRFDGTAGDMRYLVSKWLDHHILSVRSLNFCGYDTESKSYIFPNFGYHNGQRKELNKMKFIDVNKCNIKSTSDLHLTSDTNFKNNWIDDWKLANNLNGMVLLSWWIGTLFAEQIRLDSKDWPFLEYTGEQGAGKSCQIGFLWKCLGRDNYEGFDPNKDTKVAWLNKLDQLSNMPAVILESDRVLGDKNAHNKGFGFEQLKSLADGGELRARGQKNGSNGVNTTKFKGGLLISQNSEVDGDDAVLSRIIHCHCTKQHHNNETLLATQRLMKLSVEDCCGFLHQVLSKENELFNIYTKKFTELQDKFYNRNPSLQMRLITLHAKIAAWAWTLPTIFENKVTFAEVEKIEDYIYSRAVSRQQRLGADHPTVQIFWEKYDFLNEQYDRVNKTTKIYLNHSNKKDEIAINIQHFIKVCNEEHTERLPTEAELKKLLPQSRRYRFISKKTVRSQILCKPVYCWVFSSHDNENRKLS